MSQKKRWWESVKRFLRKVGEFQSALLLSLIYLIFWIPVGLLTRLLADWLHFRPPARSAWTERSDRVNDPAHLREPF